MEDIEGLNLKELAEKLLDVRMKKEELSKIEKDLSIVEEEIERKMIDEMINEGQSSVKYADLGLFSLTTQAFPRIVDDAKFFKYLKETGQISMARYTVNNNTLKGWWNKKIDVDLKPENIGLEVFTRTKLNVRRI